MRKNPTFPLEYDLKGSRPYRLNWEDVRNIWRSNEENLEHWIQYYQSQGYKNWDEWREKFFRRFGVRHLEWDLFEMTNQIQVISRLRGADFRGWRNLTGGQKHLTFWEMAQLEAVQGHKPLRDFIENFPKETTIIAIRYKDDIFVIEGMHRCVAYVVALKEGKVLNSKIKIILGRKDGPRPFFLGARL